MNTMQRKMYADAALDLITSLDNDLQSLTGQADNCLKELDDPTKDDYEARNKAYEYAKQYAYTQAELLDIMGYGLNYNSYGYEISLLNVGSVNYGAYLYGTPHRTVQDIPGIYNNWFKRYGEYGWEEGDCGNRTKTFKTGKFFPEGDLMATTGGDDSFSPNLYPIRYIEKIPDSGLIHDMEWYRNSFNIIGQGIPHRYRETYYRTVEDKPPAIVIDDPSKIYTYYFRGRSIYSSYWSYEARDIYWTGTLKKGSIITLFTEDESKRIFAKVRTCSADWDYIPERISSTSSSGSGDSYYNYYYRYHINIQFEVISNIPYYYEQIGNKSYKRFYSFYPMKRAGGTTEHRIAFASLVQSLIREKIERFYHVCQEEGDKRRYADFLNIYSISLNSGNYMTVFNNMGSLDSFLRYRWNLCYGVWSDCLLATSYNDCLNDRLNKSDGSLKRWYEGAAVIDSMEKDYYKKLRGRGNVFRKCLVQKPAEDFKGGNKMVIETAPASYYKYILGYQPSFNVGDTVYIRDDEHNETACTIIGKQTVKIMDTAEVQYESVERNDGKKENVAKLDKDGEPITIYTYKNAIELTFNGNIPAIYDPDTLRIVKEL